MTTTNNDYNPQDIIAAHLGVSKLTSYEVAEWKAMADKWVKNPSATDPAHAVVMMAAASL